MTFLSICGLAGEVIVALAVLLVVVEIFSEKMCTIIIAVFFYVFLLAFTVPCLFFVEAIACVPAAFLFYEGWEMRGLPIGVVFVFFGLCYSIIPIITIDYTLKSLKGKKFFSFQELVRATEGK
jgi:hypothetical protein